MPNRTVNLIVFLVVASTLVSGHVFVFRRLRELIQRDFPARSASALPWVKRLFIFCDLPFVFLFFRGWFREYDLSLVYQLVLYPFTAWNFLMGVWMLILVPAHLAKKGFHLAQRNMSRSESRQFRPVWLWRAKQQRVSSGVADFTQRDTPPGVTGDVSSAVTDTVTRTRQRSTSVNQVSSN